MKRLSIQALRRKAKRRRAEAEAEAEAVEAEPEAELEAEVETEAAQRLRRQPGCEANETVRDSDITNSLVSFTAWVTMKTLSPASAARNQSHVVILFAWLANPLSISQADIFGMDQILFLLYITFY